MLNIIDNEVNGNMNLSSPPREIIESAGSLLLEGSMGVEEEPAQPANQIDRG